MAPVAGQRLPLWLLPRLSPRLPLLLVVVAWWERKGSLGSLET
jgi:hypothetical protein